MIKIAVVFQKRLVPIELTTDATQVGPVPLFIAA
jgi:hypothetical protein